jgi:hypothetical protein
VLADFIDFVISFNKLPVQNTILLSATNKDAEFRACATEHTTKITAGSGYID